MNFYTYFELRETATFDEIRKAYYKKMMEVHPDKSCTDTTESAQITALAWETLKDSSKRAEYDSKLKINRAMIEGLAFCEDVELNEFQRLTDDNFSLICRCGASCDLNNDTARLEGFQMTEVSKLFDTKTDIQERKEIALKVLTGSSGTRRVIEFENHLKSKSFEQVLLSAADRELQLYMLELVISKHIDVSFCDSKFRRMFKSIKFGKFSDSAREFLKTLDYLNGAESNEIEITKDDSSQIGSGWIDFNCKSIGLTILHANEESYVEIKHSSISNWYIKDCDQLIISVQNGLLNISVKLDEQIQDIADAIEQRLSLRIFKKSSETRKIIVLNRGSSQSRSRNISIRTKRLENSTRNYMQEICKSLTVPFNMNGYSLRLRAETERLIVKKITKSIKAHFRNLASLMENLEIFEF